jgi:hypothetical protein
MPILYVIIFIPQESVKNLKKERIQRQELPPPSPSKKDHISAVFFD